MSEPRCTGPDCAYCAAAKEHYRLTGCLEQGCTDKHAPERLDQGDLDAALKRVDVYPHMNLDVMLVCECGASLYPDTTDDSLLGLVNTVAAHQPTCPKAHR